MVGLSNLFRGDDRLVLVFPLPYHFHYPFSTQPGAFTRSGTFTAFPLSFYFLGNVASSAPGDPAYSNQVSYWTKLRDGSLIVACRNDCTGTSASGVALDVPCVTI